MKKIFLALCFCIAVLCAFVLMPITASATAIETEQPSTLTIIYKDGDRTFSELTIKTYRIAYVSEDGKYTLCGDFKNYPISLYDVSSQAEWQNIASTLASYAVADNLRPTIMGTTDESGTVKYEDLLPGMYLTLTVKCKNDEQTTVFENFLTAIPQPSDDGVCNYDVTAYPKNIENIPTYEELAYKVIKQWKDGGLSNRPSEVKVDIYKDNKLYKTVSLSDENNWMYEWKSLDDASKWTAVERNIADNYTVNISYERNTIILTNIFKYNNIEIESPNTGDTSNPELAFVFMCVSGFTIILLSVWKKRSEV